MNSSMPAVFEECPMGWEVLVVLDLAHHVEVGVAAVGVAAVGVAAVEVAAVGVAGPQQLGLLTACRPTPLLVDLMVLVLVLHFRVLSDSLRSTR